MLQSQESERHIRLHAPLILTIPKLSRPATHLTFGPIVWIGRKLLLGLQQLPGGGGGGGGAPPTATPAATDSGASAFSFMSPAAPAAPSAPAGPIVGFPSGGATAATHSGPLVGFPTPGAPVGGPGAITGIAGPAVAAAVAPKKKKSVTGSSAPKAKSDLANPLMANGFGGSGS